MTRFDVHTGKEAFLDLIAEVFLASDPAFDIDASVFEHLKRSFLELNLSLDGVVSKIQYMHMSHFFRHPLSVLVDPTVVEGLPAGLVEAIAPHIRSLPSWEAETARATRETITPLDDDDGDDAMGRPNDTHVDGEGSNADAGLSLADVRSAFTDDRHLISLVADQYRRRKQHAAGLRLGLRLFTILCGVWSEKTKEKERILEEFWSGSLVNDMRETGRMIK